MKLIDDSYFSEQLINELQSKYKLLEKFQNEKNNFRITAVLSKDRKNIIIESYYAGKFIKDRHALDSYEKSIDLSGKFIKDRHALDSYEKSIDLHEWYKFLGNAGIQTFSITYEEINDEDIHNA